MGSLPTDADNYKGVVAAAAAAAAASSIGGYVPAAVHTAAQVSYRITTLETNARNYSL
jgi:hypothetical protein